MSRFNMSVLSKCALMDAVGAVRDFPNREDFWVALASVMANADRYLRDYTAAVVLFNDETRERFQKEVEQTRVLLESLHLKRTKVMLDTLESAVARKDENSLIDGLRVFYAEMDILKKNIAEAVVEEGELNVKQDVKPLVMVVDDMPEMLEIITESLVGQYRMIAIDNGHSALRALETQTPDIFLLDILMPGMSGYKLAEKIRKIDKFKETPILFITDANSKEHILAAMKHGGNDYLKKPISKPVLLNTMKKHLP